MTTYDSSFRKIILLEFFETFISNTCIMVFFLSMTYSQNNPVHNSLLKYHGEFLLRGWRITMSYPMWSLQNMDNPQSPDSSWPVTFLEEGVIVFFLCITNIAFLAVWLVWIIGHSGQASWLFTQQKLESAEGAPEDGGIHPVFLSFWPALVVTLVRVSSETYTFMLILAT